MEWGEETIDLMGLAALLLPAQTRSLVQALGRVRSMAEEGLVHLSEILARLEDELQAEGLDLLDSRGTEVLASVRVQEVSGALNRMRSGVCWSSG